MITTPEPERYRGVALPAIASVRHRDEIADVQAELARVPGVTVLIHDDRCATEKRRMRKRGKLETPPERVWINERVCEGCGDCGEKSSLPVGAAGPDRVRAQDPDPSELLQPRHELRQGRLPVVCGGPAEAGSQGAESRGAR